MNERDLKSFDIETTCVLDDLSLHENLSKDIANST